MHAHQRNGFLLNRNYLGLECGLGNDRILRASVSALIKEMEWIAFPSSLRFSPLFRCFRGALRWQMTAFDVDSSL